MRHSKIIGLLALLVSLPLFALESDRSQPISILADHAEFSEVDGLTVYRGDVQLQQGSILLKSEQLSVYSKNGEIVRIVAEGMPAHYQQTPEEGKSLVVATGQMIEYQLTDDVIKLIQQASLTQEGTTLRGSSIIYDVRANQLRASGSAADQSERVQVIIPPSLKQVAP